MQNLTLSLVKIANETARQHSIYKKSCLASLDDIDYQNLMDESVPSSDLEEDLDILLSSQGLLPVSEQLNTRN